jgi:hypothetical protein
MLGGLIAHLRVFTPAATVAHAQRSSTFSTQYIISCQIHQLLMHQVTQNQCYLFFSIQLIEFKTCYNCYKVVTQKVSDDARSTACCNTYHSLPLSTTMSQPPANSDTPAVQQGKQYFCDCSQHCKGQQTLVHWTMYQQHVAFHEADLEKQLSRFGRGLNSTASTSTLLVVGSPLEQMNGDQSNGGATSSESNLMDVVPPEVV